MLNDEDVELAAEVLEPDSSAALIVWEHRWAAPVARAIRPRSWRRMQQAADAEEFRQQQAMAMPQPPAPMQAGGPPPADLVTQLKELAALKDQGILTQEEFDVQKARILGA